MSLSKRAKEKKINMGGNSAQRGFSKLIANFQRHIYPNVEYG